MERTMDDFTALLGNLTRTCQELEEIKVEQAKDHKRISKSFERALLSIQHQKQSVINQVEEEHGQLRAKLLSLQRVNEQALQEGVSEINSMVQQIAKVPLRLKSQNSSEDNTAIMKEIQEHIAGIFNKNRSIIIRLKKIQFTPNQLPAPALGEVHYEEQTFGFSVPYVEGKEYMPVNGTKADSPMLSDEPPPWELTSSDSGSVENGGIYDRKASPDGDSVGSNQLERNGSRGQLVEKRFSGERITSTREETVVISPKTRTESDTETNALGTRTVSKIRISDTESSCSATDSEEKSPSSTGDGREYRQQRTTQEDRLRKQIPLYSTHSLEAPVLLETTRATLRGIPSQMSLDRNCTPGWTNKGITATTLMENQPSQATEAGAANFQNQSHSLVTTGANVPAESSLSHLKKCSQNTDQFSNNSELESTAYLEQDVTRPYNTNNSKAGKREHEEHTTERKHGVSDLISQFTNINAQNNILQTTSCTEKQTLKTFRPSSLDLVSNQDSVFRATTAFVYEEDSDNSVEGPDGRRTEERDKDSKAFRVVAIQASRVPSAQKIGSTEQLSKWNSTEFVNNVGKLSVVNNSAADESVLRLSNPTPFQFTRFSPNRVGESAQKKMTQQREDQLKSFKISDKELAQVQRSPSPTESVKSSYTFIIESPRDEHFQNGGFQSGVAAMRERKRLPETSNERSRRGRPVIDSCAEPKMEKSPVQISTKKRLDRTVSSPVNGQHPGAPGTDIKRCHFANSTRASRNKTPDHIPEHRLGKAVSRSSSMPVIDKIPRSSRVSPCSPSIHDRRDSTSSTSSSNANARPTTLSTASRVVNSAIRRGRRPQSGRVSRQSSETSQQHLQRTRSLSKSESCLRGDTLEEEEGPYTNKLIGVFSKFGSGRGELNLPHGIHTTLMGALYVVDYGNRRVQVMDCKGCILQQITLAAKNYFDIAVNNKGLVALTNSSDRTVEVYSKHGKLLQVISRNMNAPRGITSNFRDEFVIADMKLGTLTALTVDLASGRQLESTIIPGFNKPYLLSANNQGLVAVSERGFDGGSCVKILNDDWQVVRVLGQKGGLGPALFNPWGVCLDNEGDVLVADWGQAHSVIHYPMKGSARAVVTDGLSSPRGLAVLQDQLLLVADSMHNCIKVFQYK